ncbi:MAG: hypothetical protein V1811_02225 [Candidatus Micrarchaeota archaeon]
MTELTELLALADDLHFRHVYDYLSTGRKNDQVKKIYLRVREFLSVPENKRVANRSDFPVPRPFASVSGTKVLRRRAIAVLERAGFKGNELVVSVTSRHPNLRPPAFDPALLPGSRELTFDLFPHRSHLNAYAESDNLRQTIAGAVGHLSLVVRRGNAVITQIQGNASSDVTPVEKAVREQYSGWKDVLIEAAKEYCKENKLTLWLLHKGAYEKAHLSWFGAETLEKTDRKALAERLNIKAKYASLARKHARGRILETEPVFREFEGYRIFEPRR